jgi:hypothetical protein
MATSMTNANGRQCQEQQEVQEQRERRGRQRGGAEKESVGIYTEEDRRPEMISAAKSDRCLWLSPTMRWSFHYQRDLICC